MRRFITDCCVGFLDRLRLPTGGDQVELGEL
jgi:hypothetical protein